MGSNKRFQKQKIKDETRLRRNEAKRVTKLTILIIGEGVTEYNYFNDMRRFFRGKELNIILRKPSGSAPISIVDSALDFCEGNEDIHYVFCVFDRDEHPSFDAALDKLRRYQSSISAKSRPVFKAITSVPCFEIWLIIHFIYSTKSYARSGSKSPGDNVYDNLLKEFPDYSKTMTNLFVKLKPKLDIALVNAKKLATFNEQHSTTNPSTNMHNLIEFIFEKVGIDV